jgi:hypothetical protein
MNRRVARIARNPGGVSRKKPSAVEPANENQLGFSGFIIPCRTPRPMLGPADQVCSHGVLMDVCSLLPEFGFAIDLKGIVSRLPERIVIMISSPYEGAFDLYQF